MNTLNSTSEYLLLFRGNDWDRSISTDEMEDIMAKFASWFEKLTVEGTLKAGQPLLDDARIVSGRNGRMVADGPYAESKEAIGGYFLIRAESLDEATAIAQQCPTLNFGAMVEVRPVAADCPTLLRMRALKREEELAGAAV